LEIRVLKPEEHLEYSAICQNVFFDNEPRDIRKMRENPLEHAQKDDCVRIGVFGDKGRLESAMSIIPYTMRMNNHESKMAGIGGVVTLPEARSRGHVKKIMEASFPIMREAGQDYSFLFPFSYAYYRHFGYEICLSLNRVKLPVSLFRDYPYPLFFEPYEPGDSATPIAEVYADFAGKRNLSIIRGDKDWERILKRDPYQNREFTYVHYTSDGQADAYILYDAVRDRERGNRIMIKECCWKTPRALHGIFGFIGKLGAEFQHVCWDVPSDINIHALFRECYEMEWTVASSGMNRIVNVGVAMSNLRAPTGSGSVVIKVNDAFLPDNSGVYAIQWEGGRLTSVKGQESAADLETSVETLTQLATGFITPAEAVNKKDTVVHSRFNLLSALFPKQPIYMYERF